MRVLNLSSDILYVIMAYWLEIEDLQILDTAFSVDKDRSGWRSVLQANPFVYRRVNINGRDQHQCDWVLRKKLRVGGLNLHVLMGTHWPVDFLVAQAPYLRDIEVYCKTVGETRYIQDLLNTCTVIESLKIESFGHCGWPDGASHGNLMKLQLRKANVRIEQVKSLALLCPNLTELSIKDCVCESDFGFIFGAPSFSRVKTVVFENSGDGKLLNFLLGLTPSLTSLYCDCNVETVLSIHRMNLEHCRASFARADYFCDFLNNCTALKTLVPGDNMALGGDEISALTKHAPHLQVLQVCLGYVGCEDFPALLESMPQLEDLQLAGFGMGWEQYLEAIAKAMTSLTRLSLMSGLHPGFSDVLVRIIKSNPHLRVFRLTYGNVPGLLPAFEEHGCIEDISLLHVSSITDADVESLLQRCPRLTRLSLSNAREFTDAALQCAARHGSLRELLISVAGVTAEAIASLATAQTALREVFLCGTDDITDAHRAAVWVVGESKGAIEIIEFM